MMYLSSIIVQFYHISSIRLYYNYLNRLLNINYFTEQIFKIIYKLKKNYILRKVFDKIYFTHPSHYILTLLIRLMVSNG